jgi:hypothetical protein
METYYTPHAEWYTIAKPKAMKTIASRADRVAARSQYLYEIGAKVTQ